MGNSETSNDMNMSENGYFDLSENIDEFKDGVGIKEKALAGLKIFGKSLFNTGKYAWVEILPKISENSAEIAFKNAAKDYENALKNNNLTYDEEKKIKESLNLAKKNLERIRNIKMQLAKKSIQDNENALLNDDLTPDERQMIEESLKRSKDNLERIEHLKRQSFISQFGEY